MRFSIRVPCVVSGARAVKKSRVFPSRVVILSASMWLGTVNWRRGLLFLTLMKQWSIGCCCVVDHSEVVVVVVVVVVFALVDAQQHNPTQKRERATEHE